MEHVAKWPSNILPGAVAVLTSLLACAVACPEVMFGFDVVGGTYVADISAHLIEALVVSGPMSLAVYNELKLSGFIREDDSLSHPDYRQFTLTDHGLRIAGAPST